LILSFTPPSGPVGTQVTITGTGFTGATKVTFGGVKATSFVVNSGTQVTAKVPTGAKTGKIGITTAGGSATSKGTFTVK
jgi:IPT/TIG domain-containing protein